MTEGRKEHSPSTRQPEVPADRVVRPETKRAIDELEGIASLDHFAEVCRDQSRKRGW